MISIIICSRSNDILLELRQNIAETIGCEYELVVIDNSENKYSIFEAYNEGVKNSKGEVLCFCHDDILFQSKNWGHRVVSHFINQQSLGVLGVAGAHFLPSVPMYWSSSPFISEHNLNNDHGIHERFFHDEYFQDKDVVEVVVVDGLCFFMPKDLFKHVRYDEFSYNGFHLYDMDICLQAVSCGYKIMVCKDILIEHSWSENDSKRSKGLDVLEKNLSIFCDKWSGVLPLLRGVSMPDYTLERLNRLCVSAYDAKQVRKSKAYKLGRFLLKPTKLFNR